MIGWPVALKAHLAQPYQTVSTCWKLTRVDGTVVGLTDHDIDITFDGVTYHAGTGYTRSDIAGSSELEVDNLDVDGVLRAPAITEADLHAGVWDYAFYEIFIVNWASLSDGRGILKTGWLGEVTVERNAFKATLAGLAQAYQRILGELTSPGCRNILGDARCQVDLTPFTVTGTLTGVGADNQTIYDTSRTEPGPTGGAVMGGISGGNVVTLRTPLVLANGAPITISGMTGTGDIATFNRVTRFLSPGGNPFGIQFLLDASPVGAYDTDSGLVTPLGGNTGYFDFGVITFTSGLNDGLSMEIRSYVEGQFTLMQAMPYALAIGDAYTAVAGCDKSVATCHDRFDHVRFFRGEPYLPGNDRIMQVGKQ